MSASSSAIELPPSPNWYQAGICSATAACGGLLAFGAKNSVLVLAFRAAGEPGEQAEPATGRCARIVGSLVGHSDRVSGVAFVADPTGRQLAHLLVSVANDGGVRLWDARPGVMLALGKLGSHDKAATAVACSPCAGASDVVLSAGRDGTVRVWSIKSKTMRSSWRPLTATGGPVWPCAVALSPASARIAAVGYQSGVVLIVDLERSAVLQKLAGHEEQIQALAFRPQQLGSSSSAGGLSGAVLASTSKDRTIRLWEAQLLAELEDGGGSSGDGGQWRWRCADSLAVPKPTAGALTPQQKTRLWVACCWSLHADMGWVLCTTGYVGDIHVWPSREKSGNGSGAAGREGKALQPLPITGGHSRPIFGMCCLEPTTSIGGEPIVTQNESSQSHWLLTVSMDRSIVCWDVDALQSRWTMPSLGGFVYRVKFAPSDPYRMAIAVGDKSIRIWRRPKLLPATAGGSEPSMGAPTSEFDVSFLWKGVREKVTALCWHPTDETKLAFGLDDGAVGIYTLAGGTGADGHVHKMFDGQHRGTVFALVWPAAASGSGSGGGRGGGDDKDPPVYSAGADGHVFRWTKKKVMDVDSLILAGQGRLHEGTSGGAKSHVTQRSCVAFSADSQKVALGNADGSVEVYLTDQPASPGAAAGNGNQSTGWRLVRVYHEHSALVYTLVWGHANADWPEEQEWLASGSEDCTIRVHDTKDAPRLSAAAAAAAAATPGQDDQADPFRRAAPVETDRLALLRGHTRAITELAWSPHTRGLLASSCLDGTAQVWNVTDSNCAVANMRDHAGRVLCVAWSPLEPDILHSGADDQTVRRWSTLSQLHTSPPARRKAGKRDSQKPSNPAGPASPSLPQTPPTTSTSGGSRQRKARVKRKPKGILSELAGMDSSDETMQKSCLHLASQTLGRASSESPVEKPTGNLPMRDRLLFGGPGSAVETVDSEIVGLGEARTSGDAVESGAILEMWRGNVGAALSAVTAARSNGGEDSTPGDLSTWTALSILAGRDVWQSMMEVQGQALISRGDIHNGVLHLLAAEQTQAAVSAYREAGMFHEALTLAKLRLGDDDAIVKELYVDYAASLEKKRDFTTATKCYLAAGLPQKAVQTLTRRGDVSAYKQAYEISCMITSGGGDHSLAALCGCECQALGEWEAAASYYLRHDELKPYLVFLSAEEAFRSAVPPAAWSERVRSSWEHYGISGPGTQITVPTFRATVWTYDRRLQSALGQVLLQLAERTVIPADEDTAEASWRSFAELIEEGSDIVDSDLERFREIVECCSAK